MKLAIPLVAIALLLNACSSGVKVNTDYNPEADFVSLVEYDWISASAGKAPASTLTIEARDEVRQSINRALIDEGYRKSDDGIVDFYVNFHADAQDKVDVDAVASTYGYYGYPGWYPTDSAVYVQQYKEGTLMIDIIDRTGKKLIWRGTGEARLSEHSTADDRRKAIDEAVRKVLAGFPPKLQ